MRHSYILVILLIVTSITGCASIVSGTDQNLTFNSEPDEATVIVAGKVVGKTPLSVQLKKGKNQSLSFEKEGYKTHTTQLSTTLDGWFWGNILLGGFFGSTTDSVSGGMNEFSPDQYFVTLTSEKTFDVSMTRSGQIRELVIAFGDEIRLELVTGGGERTDALLAIIGTEESGKETAILALQKLSLGNENDMDFANSIIKLYTATPAEETGIPVSSMDTTTPAKATGIPVSRMDYVLKFRGFSIQKPTDDRWQLHSDNQKPRIATFSFVPLSPTHSFNATVQNRGIPADFATKQEFKEFVDARLRERDSRFDELSFTSTLTELHGEWAVTYKLRYLDKNPANSTTPLFMTIKGFMYVHPYWKNSVIDAFYSERGTKAELDGTLDPVGQKLIDGTSPEKS